MCIPLNVLRSGLFQPLFVFGGTLSTGIRGRAVGPLDDDTTGMSDFLVKGLLHGVLNSGNQTLNVHGRACYGLCPHTAPVPVLAARGWPEMETKKATEDKRNLKRQRGEAQLIQYTLIFIFSNFQNRFSTVVDTCVKCSEYEQIHETNIFCYIAMITVDIGTF